MVLVEWWTDIKKNISLVQYITGIYYTVQLQPKNQTPIAFINMLRHYEAPDIIVLILHSHNHHSLNLQLRFWLFFPSAIG